MNDKQWISIALATTMLLGVNVAQASSAYKNAGGIFEVTYPGNTASCFVCHTGYPGAMTAYGNQFKTAGGVGGSAATTTPLTAIAALDADNDGFTNGQEFNGKSNVIDLASTPFTTATGGKALANAYVIGDTQAVEFTITDIYAQAGITLPVGKEVMGGATATSGVAVDIYASPSLAAPVTLLLKAGAPDAAAIVYVIDTYTQTNIPLAATAWAIAPNGGVQINTPTAGWPTPARIAVVRTIPVATPVGGGTTIPITGTGDNDGEGDDENSTSVGCLTGSLTLPMLILFGLLGLGFLTREKKC